MTSHLEPVLAQYHLANVNIEPISVGLIHETMRVIADEGAFILQKLHPMLASKEIADDFIAVTQHLEKKNITAPKAILNKQNALLTHVEKDVWRMQTALPGNTFETIRDENMAFEAGKALATFHNALSDIDYEFKTDLILHQTEKEFEKLLEAAERYKSILEEVKSEFDFIHQELPKLFLPKNLPKRVIHGDPKISNILFDDNMRAIALIDLDTCSRQTVLNDIGDALRSWCGGKEDDPKNVFNEPFYHAALEGYLSEAAFLTKEEKSLIPQSVKTITLELAARFLADYFNDNYFGWDESRYSSRKEHNLARCRGQIALYKSISDKS